MPQELPDSVFDWKDEDADVEFEGAEDEYYLNLPTPYRCKNANFETVEELLLVKGAYPELLYGDGVSGTIAGRAAGLGGGMQIGGLSDQDFLARGLFNYLTVYSREPNPSGQGTRVGRINVNTAPREVLRCLPGITDADVSTIVSRREGNGFGNPGTEWVRDALGERVRADRAIHHGRVVPVLRRHRRRQRRRPGLPPRADRGRRARHGQPPAQCCTAAT